MTQLAGHPSTLVPTLDPEPVGHVDLAVVGAGAAATLLMAQLERRWVGDLPRTAVIEKERCLGPGVAYRTDDTRHRMNVRSCQLTAFPDQPDDFVAWVRERDPAASPDDYVPRALFGRYLREVLDRVTAAPARVTRIHAEVTSVLHGPPWPAPKEPKAFGGEGVLLVGRDGPVVRADHVVAIGVPPTGPRRFAVDPEAEASGRYIGDPWRGAGLQAVAGADRVILVGTGLTMVDAALSLLDGHDVREVVAVSTTGRLPEAHPAVRALATRPVGRPDEATARGVVRWLREVSVNWSTRARSAWARTASAWRWPMTVPCSTRPASRCPSCPCSGPSGEGPSSRPPPSPNCGPRPSASSPAWPAASPATADGRRSARARAGLG
ncbi:MAG: FAD/NAD(P)-binding protein [Acidimicrobiales bacterium]